jgi:hypothetical protein
MDGEDMTWTESAENRLQWRALILNISDIQFLLVEYYIIIVPEFIHRKLTIRSRVLAKTIVALLVKKFSVFYGTRSFITIFTRACHWILFWATWSSPYPLSLWSIFLSLSLSLSHTHLWLQSGFLPSRFTSKYLNILFISPRHATYPASLIFICLITT